MTPRDEAVSRPTVLVIDDEMSGSSPDSFLSQVKGKLERCVQAAGCAISWPKSPAEAERAGAPALLVLDIDLSRWRKGLTGYGMLAKIEERPGQFPLFILSKEPKVGERKKDGAATGIRAFAQSHEVVWLSKMEFLQGEESFLSNRIRSMAWDIHNRELSLRLDAPRRILAIARGKEEVCKYKFPNTVGATFVMDLVQRIIQGGNVGEDFLAPGMSDWDAAEAVKKPHAEIGNFNSAIVRATEGQVGYKLLVNGSNGWKLAIGGFGTLTKRAEAPSVVDSLRKMYEDLKASHSALESRVKGLEGRLKALEPDAKMPFKGR